MIDFIDDGPEDNGEEDYSKHISEIFGYDKSKYGNIDDDDDDDDAMESNFAQQLKEEYISSKIGIYLYKHLHREFCNIHINNINNLLMYNLKLNIYRIYGRFRGHAHGSIREKEKSFFEKKEIV